MINVLSAQKVLNQSEIKSQIPRFDEPADRDPDSKIKQEAGEEKRPYDMTELDKIINDASLILTNSNQNIIDINK